MTTGHSAVLVMKRTTGYRSITLRRAGGWNMVVRLARTLRIVRRVTMMMIQPVLERDVTTILTALEGPIHRSMELGE